MRKQKQIEAMVMSIVIIVAAVLVTLFVIKCVQMKKEEIQRALQGESETEADATQPETEETAAEVQDEILPEADPEEDVPEAGEDQPVNGPEDVEPEPETEAAAPVRDTLGCPEEILIELRARLTAYGIEWWEPYALAQMFQESRFGIYVENRNGLDKGLIQYRVTYWSAMCSQHGIDPATSIFDWRAQLNIYVQDTARRLGSGCSVQETISRHNTSDWGQYNPTYVQQVLQWVR